MKHASEDIHNLAVRHYKSGISKGKLRKAEARDFFALWREVSIAYLDVTSENARGWFKGCGYFH